MIQWLVILCLLMTPWPALGNSGTWPSPGTKAWSDGASGPTQRGTDDFSGTIGNWTTLTADGYANNWSVTSGELRYVSSPWESGAAYYSAASASTSAQYAKIKLTYLVSGGETGLLMRFSSAASTIIIAGSSSYTDIYYPDYDALVSHQTGLTWADTNTMCATVSGASLRIWKNCTGNIPDSATSWGSDTTPDITYTLSETSAGLRCGTIGNGNFYLDDFYFGDL